MPTQAFLCCAWVLQKSSSDGASMTPCLKYFIQFSDKWPIQHVDNERAENSTHVKSASDIRNEAFLSDSFGVDHKVAKQRVKVTCLDLTREVRQKLVTGWITSGKCLWVHFGVPCGTASKARFKRLSKKKTSRSTTFEESTLARWTTGCFWTRRSWLWTFCARVIMSMHLRACMMVFLILQVKRNIHSTSQSSRNYCFGVHCRSVSIAECFSGVKASQGVTFSFYCSWQTTVQI